MNLHDFQFFTLETLIIQFIILSIILWVLNNFIFKPYLKYLDEEADKREKLENDYRNIDKLNREAEEKRDEILKEAKNKADNIIVDAEVLAKKKASAILEKAESDAKSIITSAQNKIEKERQAMFNQIKNRVVDLALKINAKLFDKEQVNKDFVEKELASIK